MAKILLVEDDNNLREIYEARLQAEGFTIVSAKDGEEALVVAKQEKPDLIISDVMMPRVSGFEMLDILRNTPGFKDTKVIMLTALGQAEDQARADKLGADRYLVKSQVTLEDIVNAANELLGSTSGTAGSPAAAPAAPPAPAATVAMPVASTPSIPVATAPAEPSSAPAALASAPASQEQSAATTAPEAPAVPPVASAPAQPQASAPAVATAPSPNTATPAQSATPTAPPALSTTTAPNDDQLASAVRDLLGAENTKPGTPASAAATAADPLSPTPNGMPTLKSASTEAVIAPPTPTIPVAVAPAPTPEPTAAAPQADASSPSSPPTNAPAALPEQPNTAITPEPVDTTPGSLLPPKPEPQDAPASAVPNSTDKGEENEADNDAVTIARKKVIAPIVDAAAAPPEDLNALLAKEGLSNLATEPDDNNGQMVSPHPPGHVISPNTPASDNAGTVSTQPSQSGSIDPSSIAL